MTQPSTILFTSSLQSGAFHVALTREDLTALERLRQLNTRTDAQGEPLTPSRLQRSITTEEAQAGATRTRLVTTDTGVSLQVRSTDATWQSDEQPWDRVTGHQTEMEVEELDLPVVETAEYPLAARNNLEEALKQRFPDLQSGDGGSGLYSYDLTLGDPNTQTDFNFTASGDEAGVWTYQVIARELLDDTVA